VGSSEALPRGIGGGSGGFPRGSRGSWAPPPIPPGDLKFNLFPCLGAWGALRASLAPPVTSADASEALGLPVCTFWGRVWYPRVDFGHIFVPAWPRGYRSGTRRLVFGAYLRLVHNDAQRCHKGPQKSPNAPQSLPKGAQREPKITPRAPSGVHLALWGGPLAHFRLQMGALGPSSVPFGSVLGPSRSTSAAPADIWDQSGPKSDHVDTIWGHFWGALGRFSGSF
jgi:hypothetical protein